MSSLVQFRPDWEQGILERDPPAANQPSLEPLGQTQQAKTGKQSACSLIWYLAPTWPVKISDLDRAC
jgi:hypothetical protein